MAVNETPTLIKNIRDAIAADRAELHTAMPATVESYDAATGMVSVAPCLKRKYANGDLVDLPVISNVPVLFPRGGNAAITFDLQPGDVVLLVFAERSVDGWKTTGGKVDPKDPRKHALSDAFAIPGGYPKASPVSAALIKAAFGSDGSLEVTTPASVLGLDADGALDFINDAGGSASVEADGTVELVSGETGITATLGPDGTVALVQAGTGVDFVAQTLATLDLIMQSTVATAIGIQPLIPAPTYVAERAKLDPFEA